MLIQVIVNFGVKPVICLVNPCEHIQCTNLPTEVDCVLDICGECCPRYYYNNAEVTEFCSVLLMDNSFKAVVVLVVTHVQMSLRRNPVHVYIIVNQDVAVQQDRYNIRYC